MRGDDLRGECAKLLRRGQELRAGSRHDRVAIAVAIEFDDITIPGIQVAPDRPQRQLATGVPGVEARDIGRQALAHLSGHDLVIGIVNADACQCPDAF